MTGVATGRPGRPAAATREQALALGRGRFLAGERVDVRGIAGELGLARATMHRWFGTRDAFIGEVLAGLAEERIIAIRRCNPGSGGEALLDTFEQFTREMAGLEGLRTLLAAEQERALRVLTSSGGIVQPRLVAVAERLISEEIDAGTFTPVIATSSLAYSVVRIAEAFLYNDAIIGIRGDTDRLREVAGVLVGVSPRFPPPGYEISNLLIKRRNP
jgi:AcrR family transcriptional regulator